ncbi:MAG TPA: PKD domain-containing protein, partial [Chitinophagales bacterium]|nr:PKD domain-containing protein [Chitinophagales bacterium]
MGTAVSANDEWIELYNTGTESVSLAGWILRAEDGSPTISLSGTIEAGGYFLLERTDDESVPGITADIIYTGVLSNETENLLLLDSNGSEVDVVRGGPGWSIGGDNTTKHTAQRQADGTWITGVPTPRAVNSSENTKLPDDKGEVAGTSTKATTTKKSTDGYKQIVYAYAGQDIESVSGAYVFFKAFGVDDKNGPISGVKYRWAFGDGSISNMRAPRHIYHFPGTYIAALYVTDGEQDAKDSVLVRVTTADVAITDA